MAQIDVRTETETGHGWRYEVAVTREQAAQGGSTGRATAVRTTLHIVTLSWVDHQYWCGGSQAPSRTIESVMEFLMEREQDPGEAFTLPERFDAATARRWYPSIDARLGAAI